METATTLPTLQQAVALVDESLSSLPVVDALQALAATVLEELCEYGIVGDAAANEHLPLSERLSVAGFAGDTTDIEAVSNFLLTTLQAARMSAHLEKRTSPSSAAINLTRMLKDLHLPPPVSSSTPASAVLRTVAAQVPALAGHPLNESALPAAGQMLSSTDDAKLMRDILDRLRAEQHTRAGLLLTRLRVTAQALGVEEAQIPHVAQPRDVSLVEAASARRFLLVEGQLKEAERRRVEAMPQAKPDGVRDFIMGNVPDRGGRIADRAALMPQFSDRVSDFDAGGKKGDYGRKKASGKTRRRR